MISDSKIKPIFLISLPRSGSTLLQRILSTSNKISTTAEPWILLPMTFMQKKEGTLTQYFHTTSQIAITDFINQLPNKQITFNQEVRSFILSLYKKQCIKNEIYFLDKTPRYYEIIKEINDIFPDAKFIFLFRNPISVFSSVIKTWGNNSFGNLFYHSRDLYEGQSLISQGYELIKEKSLKINYENLIQNPSVVLKDLSEYLKVDLSEEILNEFSEYKMRGRMGDKTGTAKYKKIDIEPLTKWKEIFNSSLRKRIAFTYINSLNESYLKIQGYDKAELLSNIQNIKTTRLSSFKDLQDILKYKIILKYHTNIFFSKGIEWIKNKFLY